ncbi:type II toxin-antitoxin system RelE/ParE family toxin [Flavobacterium sp. N1736]|uniref:type II toxin-antitoxin system RelE/ParE family toxin n=1 Tax=Flavobacterium sp. N1736 TaxID=2986823 RepID=UPI002225177D|nr:type II toxin-antitoxin system RelE/ParE family toxin [Flavobacterium sp. N1736]
MKIIWSKEAKNAFYNNQGYLEQNWNSVIAQKFVAEVVHTINLIKNNPHLGKYKIDLRCNEIVISKHTSLYYEIRNDSIFIFNLQDNRQKPLQFLNL